MSRSIPIVVIALLFFIGGCESLDTTSKQLSNFMRRVGDTASGKTGPAGSTAAAGGQESGVRSQGSGKRSCRGSSQAGDPPNY